MTTTNLAEDIKKGNPTALARGITLMESSLQKDWEQAKQLLKRLGQTQTTSQRLGFSGPPGVGKSTFIEKLGMKFIEKGDKVAVLAIDPSSEITGGSILGDKTRMEGLSRSQNAFVRPSPTRGHLGGVTSSLPGVIQLCEAAGYDWVLIESVGVGQSEIELSRMVDVFTLISQPGAGDELQGIKKGILEYVDLIVVNKVDRDSQAVHWTRQQLLAALKILRSNPVSVLSCSALTGQGIAEVQEHLQTVVADVQGSRRKAFSEHWFESLLSSEFRKMLHHEVAIQTVAEKFKKQVGQNSLMPIEAVDLFFLEIGLRKK